MCRYTVEFFKPKPTEEDGYPIGVIVQDDKQIIYKAIPPEFWKFNPDIPQLGFFKLYDRERTVNQSFGLMTARKYDQGEGRLVKIENTDPEFLDFLRVRGIHNFWYGCTKNGQVGSVEEVATKLIEDLKKSEVQNKATDEFVEGCRSSSEHN